MAEIQQDNKILSTRQSDIGYNKAPKLIKDNHTKNASHTWAAKQSETKTLAATQPDIVYKKMGDIECLDVCG